MSKLRKPKSVEPYTTVDCPGALIVVPNASNPSGKTRLFVHAGEALDTLKKMVKDGASEEELEEFALTVGIPPVWPIPE